jgi:RNA polymerase sigma factor (sigma-70 family)
MRPLKLESVRSDPELVTAYRAGDERAASELVVRHGEALGRFLYGLGADAGDLDDLVQETFFKAFRAVAGWRGDATFRSWLFRIGANLRKDWHRKTGGRVVLRIEDQEIPDRADPASETLAAEMEARLLEGLGLLPRLQREVFLLRAQQGLGYDEIAAALGTTPGSARVHHHHAVKRLKELLQ